MLLLHLVENNAQRVVVVYPGRFQPFHLGHKDVFESLQQQFGSDNVYIGTSNKVELPKSPFSFSDKMMLMNISGISNDRVIEVSQTYKPQEYINGIGFDPASTVMIFAVGAHEIDRLEVDANYSEKTPTGRVAKIPAGKSVGDAKPLKTFTSLKDCVTADQHQYVIRAAERTKNITIDSQSYNASHGTQVRQLYDQLRDDQNLVKQFFMQLYGQAPAELKQIFDKIPESQTTESKKESAMQNAHRPLTKVKHDPNAEQPVTEAGNRGYDHGFASPTAPSLGGQRRREDDEYHVPDPTPSTWYIRANGKIIKDKMGTPFRFSGKEAARKSAMTMMAKPFNAGKKFVLTTKPEDEQPVTETTGDKPFDNMMKTIKKGTAKQATQDRREQRQQSQQQARDAFGPSPADSLGIRKKPGMAEGLFGIDDKIKGRIQNVVSDLSDIPGMWDHKAQTFTDAGMDKLKTVLKNNPKYIKYALNLDYRDYEAEGVAESEYPDTIKKIQIRSRFDGSVLYSHTSMNNTVARTVLAAIDDTVALASADLRDADLRGADLRKGEFQGADLRGADLRGADLRGTDLRDADIRGANVVGAKTAKEQGVAEDYFKLSHRAAQFDPPDLEIGDAVIVTGKDNKFTGQKGNIDSFGEKKYFVVVNINGHGRQSFQTSDVSVDDSDRHNTPASESMYQYNAQDPYNSEFAPDVGMGRNTLRGWKQSMIRRTAELAKQMADAGQDIDKSALWDNVYAKLKSMNLDPVAQEIQQAHAELEKIRQRGGVRSRAFKK